MSDHMIARLVRTGRWVRVHPGTYRPLGVPPSWRADLMAAVQRDRWANASDLENQIADLRSAANAIDTGRPLLDQSEAVKTFFDRAGRVLREMSQRA